MGRRRGNLSGVGLSAGVNSARDSFSRVVERSSAVCESFRCKNVGFSGVRGALNALGDNRAA